MGCIRRTVVLVGVDDVFFQWRRLGRGGLLVLVRGAADRHRQKQQNENAAVHWAPIHSANGPAMTSACPWPSTRARKVLPVRGFFSEMTSPCLPGFSATASSLSCAAPEIAVT